MSAERRVRKIYASLPAFKCKGLCADTCGVIPVFKAERSIVSSAAGFDTGTMMGTETMKCPLLKDGRCSIYDSRPLICRLYGMVDHPLMRCPHGCEPVLTQTEGDETMRQMHSLSPK